MKNQKGITLIALVITIIVLLILAGVTIYMLTGPSGVLTNSQKAKLETMEKGAIEKINLGLNGIKTEILAKLAENPTYDAKTDKDNLKKEGVTGIKGNGDGYTVNGTEDNKITISFTTEEYKKLKKSVDGKSEEDIKVEGSINLEDYSITQASVTPPAE